jgi:hypothetical protein
MTRLWTELRGSVGATTAADATMAMSARQLSETGGTEFCNSFAAYDDLPEADKAEIDNSECSPRGGISDTGTPNRAGRSCNDGRKASRTRCRWSGRTGQGASRRCSAARRLISEKWTCVRDEPSLCARATGQRSLSTRTGMSGSLAISSSRTTPERRTALFPFPHG